MFHEAEKLSYKQEFRRHMLLVQNCQKDYINIDKVNIICVRPSNVLDRNSKIYKTVIDEKNPWKLLACFDDYNEDLAYFKTKEEADESLEQLVHMLGRERV